MLVLHVNRFNPDLKLTKTVQGYNIITLSKNEYFNNKTINSQLLLKTLQKHEVPYIVHTCLRFKHSLCSVAGWSLLLFKIIAIFYSIVFYSIVFYSIVFYSIVFYSIVFYSIVFYSMSDTID